MLVFGMNRDSKIPFHLLTQEDPASVMFVALSNVQLVFA